MQHEPREEADIAEQEAYFARHRELIERVLSSAADDVVLRMPDAPLEAMIHTLVAQLPSDSPLRRDLRGDVDESGSILPGGTQAVPATANTHAIGGRDEAVSSEVGAPAAAKASGPAHVTTVADAAASVSSPGPVVDDAEEEEPVSTWWAYGDHGGQGGRDRNSQTFDMRLNELPLGLVVYDGDGAVLAEPPLEQDASSGMYHLVVPAGGYIHLNPVELVQLGSNDEQRPEPFGDWTVQIDAQWQLTGEGGGFALFSPDAEEKPADAPVLAYVSHQSGRVVHERPSAKVKLAGSGSGGGGGAGGAGVPGSGEQSELTEAEERAAREELKRAAAAESTRWHRVTLAVSSRTLAAYHGGQQLWETETRQGKVSHRGFYLFSTPHSRDALQQPARVRMVVFTKRMLSPSEVFAGADNDIEVATSTVQRTVQKRRMRERLFLPVWLGQLGRKARLQSLLYYTGFGDAYPVIWRHPLTCELFKVSLRLGRTPDTFTHLWHHRALCADVHDIVRSMHRDLPQQHERSQRWIAAFAVVARKVMSSFPKQSAYGFDQSYNARGGYHGGGGGRGGKRGGARRISAWEDAQGCIAPHLHRVSALTAPGEDLLFRLESSLGGLGAVEIVMVISVERVSAEGERRFKCVLPSAAGDAIQCACR